MKKFNPADFESKWRAKWEEEGVYKTPEIQKGDDKEYILDMYPYPSGSGLHVGHPRGYVATDVYSRYQRLLGKKVMHPIGFDSFGLPAENYAIKTGVHPEKSTNDAIKYFKEQIEKIGLSYDWNKELSSHDPEFTKWTQWLFIQLYNAGLAYQKAAPVNWCETDQTVLANEQVEADGTCERCGNPVIQKNLKQWFFKITDYADELISGLEEIDWPESTKAGQRNWIGRSEGALIKFKIQNSKSKDYEFKIEENVFENVNFNYVEAINDAKDKKVKYMALAVIKNKDGKYLILNRNEEHDQDQWDLAGGSLDSENVKKEIKREIFEETGYEVDAPKFLFTYDGYNPEFKQVYRFFIFQAEVDGEPRLSEEHSDFEFIDAKAASEKLNWLGHQNAVLYFEYLSNIKDYLEVFTTRPDTIFGATFMVIAPEHEILEQVQNDIKNWSEVEKYIETAKGKTELERQQQKEKTGIKIEGVTAINPATNSEIPIYVADYVLGGYGTGAIMAVPAHDERDYEFAEKYGIDMKFVVAKSYGEANKDEIEKESVSAILFDKDTGKYGYIKWNTNGDVTMPAGGIDDGESKEDALRREIQEETGFTDIKIESELQPVISHYYAHNKNLWRKNTIYNYLVSVNSNDRGEDNKMDNEDFEFEWGTPEEIFNMIAQNPSELKDDIIDRYKSGIRKSIIVKLDTNNKLEKYPVDVITDGMIINSDFLNGLSVEEAKKKAIEWLSEKGIGSKQVNYKLRDWLVSRQRYWGCPIPVVYDPEGNAKLVPIEDLPVLLPTDVDFKPTGESPLKSSETFHKSAEEKYGKGYRREVDTMDTFVDSSWYFFRFTDVHNKKEFADKDALNNWMPVDLYVGGAEHTVLHLMYSRFITKFLRDQGYINFDEPFQKLRHPGMILAEDSRKMSKRWGNTVDPNDEIEKFGADTLRMYEMFIGPFNGTIAWSTKTEIGVFRFLTKIWDLQNSITEEINDKQEVELQKTIKKVQEDIVGMSFNTAVAKMMEFTNFLTAEKAINRSVLERFLIVLAPFAPYISEEMWSNMGNEFSIHNQKWPEVDESKLVEDVIEIAVQINGKVRGTISIAPDADESIAMQKAREVENIAKYIEGEPRKVIYIPGKILNIVV